MELLFAAIIGAVLGGMLGFLSCLLVFCDSSEETEARVEIAKQLDHAKAEAARLRNIICQIKSDVDSRASNIGKEAK